MYRKNTASQFLCFQGVDATTGGIKTGVTWTARRCIDGTFAAAGGTVSEDGSTGWYKLAMSQADTNGNDISFNFTGTGAVPQTVNILTTAADPSDVVHFGLTALPNTAVTTNASLLTSGTGTDQLSVASGLVNITQTAADKVWGTAARTLTAGTNIVLPSNGLSSITAWTVNITGNITGNLSGSVGSLTTNNDKTGYGLTSSYDFAKGTVAMTESYATVGATATPAQALYMIQQMLGNTSIAGTTQTTKKVDGSTTAATFTLDSATAPTSIARAT